MRSRAPTSAQGLMVQEEYHTPFSAAKKRNSTKKSSALAQEDTVGRVQRESGLGGGRMASDGVRCLCSCLTMTRTGDRSYRPRGRHPRDRRADGTDTPILSPFASLPEPSTVEGTARGQNPWKKKQNTQDSGKAGAQRRISESCSSPSTPTFFLFLTSNKVQTQSY